MKNSEGGTVMLTRVINLLLVPIFIFLAAEKGVNTMTMSNSPAEINTEIPPIDSKVPAKIETATFALG